MSLRVLPILRVFFTELLGCFVDTAVWLWRVGTLPLSRAWGWWKRADKLDVGVLSFIGLACVSELGLFGVVIVFLGVLFLYVLLACLILWPISMLVVVPSIILGYVWYSLPLYALWAAVRTWRRLYGERFDAWASAKLLGFARKRGWGKTNS